MVYTASALFQERADWTGVDLDLADVTDLDGLIDRLRETAATVAVAFIDEDDEYVAVVRVDEDEDPRVFVSDRRALEADGVAARLLADAVPVAAPPEEDAEDSGRPEVEPAGDAALFTDLGVSAEDLLALCAREGMLPADVVFAVCERLGCSEVIEEVRGL